MADNQTKYNVLSWTTGVFIPVLEVMSTIKCSVNV